jgi:hypothetical protein
MQLRRIALLFAATLLLLLATSVPAQAGKVVDNSGHRVGWASWAKVLNRKGTMKGFLVHAGHAQYCLMTPAEKLIAAIESRTTPVRLWVDIDHRTRKTWRGKALRVGDNWALYKKVAGGHWVRKGTAFGGRGATAVAALRLLLWK